jgi:hypothetical protein
VDTVAGEDGPWFVSYHGVGDPTYYGLDEAMVLQNQEVLQTFPLANPAPGSYAISVNHLHGLIADADTFDWFRRQQPAYHLGGSILVYQVEQPDRGEWVAQCLDPGPFLETVEVESLLGQEDLRHLFFDCRQSLVLGGDGAPGWLILPQADEWWFTSSLDMEEARLVYRHDAAAGTPSFDIYYWPGANDRKLLDLGHSEAELESGMGISLPYTVNPEVQIYSYEALDENWITTWTVTAATAETLSMRAHLYAAAGAPPEVADGLGFSSDQWRTGDWIIQRHVFPNREPEGYLQTGLYNFQTLEQVGEMINLPAE